MSTSSPELFVELDRSRPRALRAQLERSLRDAIRAGRLRPGVRLPSSRALAADLQITRGVVIAAYHQLTAEGYLTSRQGWGAVVNAITTPEGLQRRRPPPTSVRYDFRPGAPDVGLFPHAAWARATRGILIQSLDRYRSSPARDQPSALVMGYSRLTPHHIEEGIHHLATILNSDGVTTRPR